jgi:hypothetical protein
MQLNKQMKWIFATCYKMDQTWKHYVQWNKPLSKDDILWFQICVIPKQLNEDRK